MNDDFKESRIERLIVGLERLNELAERKFSYKASFLRGVIQGLGIIVGSTVVASALLTLLYKILSPDLVRKLFMIE